MYVCEALVGTAQAGDKGGGGSKGSSGSSHSSHGSMSHDHGSHSSSYHNYHQKYGTQFKYGHFYSGRYHPPALVERLGEEFYTLAVGFKPWPTTNRAHPFIEAALELAARHPPDTLTEVHVRGGNYIRTFCEPLATRQRPRTSVEAEDSIFFGVAKAWSMKRDISSDWPVAISERARPSVTMKPSRAMRRINAGRCRAISPTTKNVAWVPASASASRSQPVDESRRSR